MSSSSSSRPVLHTSRASRRRSSDRSSGLSSSRTYHTTTYASPPPPVRLFPDEKLAREGEGLYCPASLPKPGERVDVQGAAHGYRTATVISSTPATQTSLYGKAGQVLSPVPGFEEDCTVTVQYSDGSTGTLSAAEEPTPLWQEVAPLVAYGALGLTRALPDGKSVWESAEEEHEDLLAQLDADGEATAPPSGEYWGKSEERDEGDQAVRSTINFLPNGIIEGRGKDGVDGAYRITRGRWGIRGDHEPTEIAWIEVYDEGFSVVVKGKYDARSGTIKAHFASSRSVRGKFELAPKPSIF